MLQIWSLGREKWLQRQLCFLQLSTVRNKHRVASELHLVSAEVRQYLSLENERPPIASSKYERHNH